MPQFDIPLGESPLFGLKVLKHVTKWEKCGRCPLGPQAFQHVLGRGSLPCNVLFIGEAPGVTEDALGKPFVGRSGKLLDKLVSDSRRALRWKYTYAVNNVLACIPRSTASDHSDSAVRPPHPSEVRECSPRLVEFLGLAQPSVIVLLGKSAQQYSGPLFDQIIQINLVHPAFILRKGGVGSLDYKRTLLHFIDQLKPIRKIVRKEARGLQTAIRKD